MATPKEKWKHVKIKQFKGEFLISETGRIKRVGRYAKTTGHWIEPRFLTPQVTKKGYLRISLRKNGISRWFYIHRLVALFHIPNTENKPCVNHKDGNKLNNHVSNLEWCTDAENNAHAKSMGLFDGANSKIPKEQRKFIKENFFVIGRKGLSEMFNLPEDYIMSVAKVKIRGTSEARKAPIKHKEIININTGEKYISDELAKLLGKTRKWVLRMISEERKPNISPYRYTGRYVQSG